MDENQENQPNTDGLNSLTPEKDPATKQDQRQNNESTDIGYSDLDIEESTGGSAMEDQENVNSRDIDDEEI